LGRVGRWFRKLTFLCLGLLGRQPAAAELAAGLNALNRQIQTPYGVFPGVYGSAEFQNTGAFRSAPDHSNGLYLSMLYFLILGRDMDLGGFTFWKDVLDSGGPGIYDSGQAGSAARLLILGTGPPNEGFIGSAEFQGRFQ